MILRTLVCTLGSCGPTKLEKAFVLEYQQKLCNWCKVLLGDAKECDHIIPKKRQMLHVLHNYQYLCCNCHGLKNRLESKRDYIQRIAKGDKHWLECYLISEIRWANHVANTANTTGEITNATSEITSSLLQPAAFLSHREASMKTFLTNSTNFSKNLVKARFTAD